jgi:hypothetical protein
MSWFLVVLAALVPLAQPGLEEQARTFAEAWGEKDAEGLREAMAEGGIRLHLPGEEHHLISPRQAEAALTAFLERYEGGDVRISRVALTGESPNRGYSELDWATGSPGVTGPVKFTVFVAFSARGNGWVVTEIRVLF